MRESLSLRVALLAVLLPVAATLCVVLLVMTGVIHFRIAHLVASGGAILIVAILAAAISALGPKYRPTPLLTPLFAGIISALLATTAIYAVHAHVGPKRTAVAAAEVQLDAKPSVKAVKTAPVIAQAAAEPDLSQQPVSAVIPAFEASAFAPADLPQDQMQPSAPPAASAAAEPKGEADRSATGGPLVDVANAVVAPAKAEEKPAADGEKKSPVVVAKIPLPAAAPDVSASAAKAAPNAPLNLTASFDPTGPTWPVAEGPPMALDGTAATDGTTPKHAAIPPLPRIRPCGGDGPACP